MSSRRIDFNYTSPNYEEVEALTRQAHAMRSQVLAQGVKWAFRQISAGLHWLVGLEWGDAARRRRQELELRHLRASSPAHLEPSAPGNAPAEGGKLAVAGREAGRTAEDKKEKARAA